MAMVPRQDGAARGEGRGRRRRRGRRGGGRNREAGQPQFGGESAERRIFGRPRGLGRGARVPRISRPMAIVPTNQRERAQQESPREAAPEHGRAPERAKRVEPAEPPREQRSEGTQAPLDLPPPPPAKPFVVWSSSPTDGRRKRAATSSRHRVRKSAHLRRCADFLFARAPTSRSSPRAPDSHRSRPARILRCRRSTDPAPRRAPAPGRTP